MAAVLKARNQFSAGFKYITHDSLEDIAHYVRSRIEKGRGTMVVRIRDDGRVQVLRDDLLEDDSGKGVVGHFMKRHQVPDIIAKLEVFQARFPEYRPA